MSASGVGAVTGAVSGFGAGDVITHSLALLLLFGGGLLLLTVVAKGRGLDRAIADEAKDKTAKAHIPAVGTAAGRSPRRSTSGASAASGAPAPSQARVGWSAGLPAHSHEMEFSTEELPAVATWYVSPQREAYVRRSGLCFLGWLAFLMIGLAGVIEIVGYHIDVEQSPTGTLSSAFLQSGVVALFWAAAAGGAVGMLWSYSPYFSARQAYRQWRLALAAARVDDALQKAAKQEDNKPPLPLAALFQLNRRQLDEYQLITRKQQRLAFLCAQAACVVAFVVLIGGIVFTFHAPTTTDKYISGGLSALGSLLSGFVAATFFKAAGEANTQMNLYYLEPQRTGRLLATERIVGRLREESNGHLDEGLLKDIVEKVLTWEVPMNGSSLTLAGHQDRKAPAKNGSNPANAPDSTKV